MRAREKKVDAAIMNCYREMYKASEPPADFDKLIENAPVDERTGGRIIPYQDHEIEEEVFNQILEKYMTDEKLKLTKREKERFSVTIYLGCSPRFKR
jgi:hypothetical protein